MEPPTIDNDFERLIAVLTRIAAALERAIPVPAPPPTMARPFGMNMVQCQVCNTWFTLGTSHFCTGGTFSGGSAGG